VKYTVPENKIKESSSHVECKSVNILNKKIDWGNADIAAYQSTLKSFLDQNFELWCFPENLQILALAIPSSFIYAAELSAPSKASKKPNFKVFKSEEWRKAEIKAKSASKKWIHAGRPRIEGNELFEAKKISNIQLRKAIKTFNNETNTEENNKMMNANFRDPKLFSQLVNKKKSNSSGYTTMIKFDETEFRGDAQVLSGFFRYHDEKSSPPEVYKSDENHTYYYSTIDVDAISYIIKQRKWKLPQLNFNQVQNLIERLKVNKAPDYFGFSAKHIKYGGNVSVKFLMEYLNLSFKFIEHGVPSEELVGSGSLVHKGGKKSLCDPRNFRKITVCALLGQLKQMAVCDLTLPILRPVKSPSQLGFTPGLFVKLANIMVTEKRAWALAHDQILLIQFLDATAAFDRTLHPVILSHLYNEGVQDDQWRYFELLHDHATSHIKWNGKISENVIKEAVGNRQGGYSSADEWKLYGNPMIAELEEHGVKDDIISGAVTNVIAVADDVAPCTMADTPREVLHRMQTLLNVVEVHGIQNHIEFGKDKCELLIAARPGKLRAVEELLKTEPGILTFFDFPIKQVDDSYTHIGVPQSPRHQSKNAVDYRITKGDNMTYKLQSSTLNTLCGISPISNRKMFLSYHQPSFLYGLDTMPLNSTDMKRLETRYRQTLKHMLSLPECVSSPLVYLTIGIMPVTAQRDLEILGLLGQLAICDQDEQNVRRIIHHNLAFFDVKFGGWSSLVRKTAAVYGLPDPLQYMEHPWRPDRWRSHCREVITGYWDNKLKGELFNEGEERSSALYVDLLSLTTSQPMRIWQLAGLDSNAVKEATPISWMYCGTYFTRELLHKMKKVKTPICACTKDTSETLAHFILHCELYNSIREHYVPKYVKINKHVISVCDDEQKLILSILDPLSSKLPDIVTSNWTSVKEVYSLSRKFIYRMHLKREKIYKDIDGNT
jgi:hypothetical protein